MEIQTAPRPPAPTPWSRSLLFAALLGPVTLFVLLPIGLGLQRYVMTGDSMAGTINRGSVVFERVVPVSDVQVGDVVTYPRPDSGEGRVMVTHRVVAIRADGLVTRGDGEPTVDPWVLRPADSTISRALFSVPGIGWAYLLLSDPWGWLVTMAAALALLVLTRLRRGRRKPAPRDGDEAAAPVHAPATGPKILVDTRGAGHEPTEG